MTQACCQPGLQSSTEQWGVRFPVNSAAGLCHCNYTYEDLLTIQVCSDPLTMHCSTALGKMLFPLLNAALQNSLTAALCHCNYTYEGFVIVQVCSEPTIMHCSTAQGEMHPPCSVLLCKTGSQQACVRAITPVKICSSCRCAVSQQKRTAALICAKNIPHCSLLLFKTG